MKAHGVSSSTAEFLSLWPGDNATFKFLPTTKQSLQGPRNRAELLSYTTGS